MAGWTTDEQQALEKKLDERNKLGKERKGLIEKKAKGELTPEEAERLNAIDKQGAELKKEIDGLVQEKLDAAKGQLQKDFPGSNVGPKTPMKPDDDMKDSWTASAMVVKDGKKLPEIDLVGVAWKTVLRHSLSFLIANLQHESWELDCLKKYAADHQLDFDKLIREEKSKVLVEMPPRCVQEGARLAPQSA